MRTIRTTAGEVPLPPQAPPTRGALTVQTGELQGAGAVPAPRREGAGTGAAGTPRTRLTRTDRAPRQDRLRVRVLPDEMARWRAAAQASGCKGLSTWLRAIADEAAAAGDDPRAWRADLARVLRDLNAGVGTNLNSLARGVHEARRRGGDRAADARLAAAEGSLAAMAADLAAMRAAILALLAPRRPRRCQSGEAGARRTSALAAAKGTRQ